MVSRSFFFVHQRKLLHPPFENQPPAEATKQEHRPATHRKTAPANRSSDPPQNRKIKHDIRTEMVILHSSLLSYPLQEVCFTEGVHFDLYLFLFVYVPIVSAFITCQQRYFLQISCT